MFTIEVKPLCIVVTWNNWNSKEIHNYSLDHTVLPDFVNQVYQIIGPDGKVKARLPAACTAYFQP